MPKLNGDDLLGTLTPARSFVTINRQGPNAPHAIPPAIDFTFTLTNPSSGSPFDQDYPADRPEFEFYVLGPDKKVFHTFPNISINPRHRLAIPPGTSKTFTAKWTIDIDKTPEGSLAVLVELKETPVICLATVVVKFAE